MTSAMIGPDTRVEPRNEPRVALVHDYFTQRGGAERVALAMAEIFPGARMHTSVVHPGTTFPEVADLNLRASWMDRVPLTRDHPRAFMPLYAPTFSHYRISDADVVLCSSSGWAHGVATDVPKVVYCHTPARWLWAADEYVGNKLSLPALALAVTSPFLRRWDRKRAAEATTYIANSTVSQRRIREAYGINAEIQFPPCSMSPDDPTEQILDATGAPIEPGFVLSLGRLLPYKNVEVAVRAFASRPRDRLLIVGTGPDEQRLRTLAGPNIVFAGEVSDAQVRWAYANARVVVALAFEDFGLVPIEAACFGKPVVALRAGGFLDSLIEGETGLFIDDLQPSSLGRGIDESDATTWDPEISTDHAGQFDVEHFGKRLKDVVMAAAGMPVGL